MDNGKRNQWDELWSEWNEGDEPSSERSNMKCDHRSW